jgi:hypothetical protein
MGDGVRTGWTAVYYSYNTQDWKETAMFENPVAKRTAIAAAVGAVIAIPVPFVGPLFGGAVGAAIGFFTARGRG